MLISHNIKQISSFPNGTNKINQQYNENDAQTVSIVAGLTIRMLARLAYAVRQGLSSSLSDAECVLPGMRNSLSTSFVFPDDAGDGGALPSE
jgi:hypothetical protein